MNVLIIEDEGVAARRITKMATALSLNVVGTCKSIKSLEKFLIENEEPDFYLSDIHLSDGLIFDYLDQNELASPIIFTTAYDKYAIKAFKENSIDYLLKPIDADELKIAVDKLKNSLQNSTKLDILQLKSMLINPPSTKDYRIRLSVSIGDKLRSINISDIALIYSMDKANFITTADGRSYPLDTTLDELHNELDPKQFFKINRGAIVNIDFIKEAIQYSNSRLKIILKIDADQELIVARDRVKDFKRWF